MTRASERVERVPESGSAWPLLGGKAQARRRERSGGSFRSSRGTSGSLDGMCEGCESGRVLRDTGTDRGTKARGCALGRLTHCRSSRTRRHCLRPLADQRSTAPAESSVGGKGTRVEGTSGVTSPAAFTRGRRRRLDQRVRPERSRHFVASQRADRRTPRARPSGLHAML